MARRRCCGLVEQEPSHRQFSPPNANAEKTIILLVEELEALRLKNLTGMDQAACALKMGVSRATFQRILNSARQKVTFALIEGHTIIIQGGTYMVKNRKFECQDCGHIWEVEPCTAGGKHGYEIACPKCGSMKKIKIGEEGQRHVCGGGHHEHGHGGGFCGH
ncbi:MAG: DUF134 domain-containing protein [Pelosinus sp.]|nr:DUF134 domain-containing protein [Pelosinus sp.]